MGKFSKFNEQINADQLTKDVEEAIKNGGTGEYEAVPDGRYTVKFEKLEVKETKDGRPMLSIMARILEDDENEGKYVKNCLFMNRVLFGTKNDANMIASAVGWLQKLECETNVTFKDYDQFSDVVLDVFEELEEYNVNALVDYKESAFNSISIVETWEA